MSSAVFISVAVYGGFVLGAIASRIAGPCPRPVAIFGAVSFLVLCGAALL